MYYILLKLRKQICNQTNVQICSLTTQDMVVVDTNIYNHYIYYIYLW